MEDVKKHREMWKTLEPVFIGMVKERPVLYDRNKKYAAGRSRVMDIAWEEIAAEIGIDVKYCKLKWKYLRDSYVKRMRLRDFSKKIADYNLSFLDEFISERRAKRQKTTQYTHNDNCSPEIFIQDSNSSSDTAVEVENNLGNATVVTKDMIESLLEQKIQENSDIDIESQIVNDIFCKNIEDTIDKHTEPYPDQYPYVQAVETPSTSEMCTNIETTDPSNLVIANICTLQPVSPTPILPDVTPSIEITDDEVKEEYEKEQVAKTRLDFNDIQTDTFFNEMGAFVASRFPLKKQTEIRLKILSIVTTAELEMLEENDEDEIESDI